MATQQEYDDNHILLYIHLVCSFTRMMYRGSVLGPNHRGGGVVL